MPSNHLILCHPLLLLPSIFPSIRVFSSESALCIRWPKYWRFSFNISSSNGHPGPISFRMDWLDLLAVLTMVYLLSYGYSRYCPSASVQAHLSPYTLAQGIWNCLLFYLRKLKPFIHQLMQMHTVLEVKKE